MMFRDRVDAGKRLAKLLKRYVMDLVFVTPTKVEGSLFVILKHS